MSDYDYNDETTTSQNGGADASYNVCMKACLCFSGAAWMLGNVDIMSLCKCVGHSRMKWTEQS